jgi:hypothetical protein
MNGLMKTADNSGSMRTHAMELNAGFRAGSTSTHPRRTWSRRIVHFLENEFDTIFWPSDTARPHRFNATGIYQLPFGKGRAYLREGILNHVLGGGRSLPHMSSRTGATFLGESLLQRRYQQFRSRRNFGERKLWISGSIQPYRSSVSRPTSRQHFIRESFRGTSTVFALTA